MHKTKETWAAYMREWRRQAIAKDPDGYRAKMRTRNRRYAATPEGRKAILRKSRRHKGIDPLAAETLLASASACEICGAHALLVPDHDHKTGKLRGALCGGCNTAIGLLRDSPALLEAAASYLRHSE